MSQREKLTLQSTVFVKRRKKKRGLITRPFSNLRRQTVGCSGIFSFDLASASLSQVGKDTGPLAYWQKELSWGQATMSFVNLTVALLWPSPTIFEQFFVFVTLFSKRGQRKGEDGRRRNRVCRTFWLVKKVKKQSQDYTTMIVRTITVYISLEKSS